MQTLPVKIKSFAKINIGLNILRRRADGFHEIETVFQQIDLADEITFGETEGGIVVTSDHSSVPNGAENICYRAANLLKEKFQIARGVQIGIQKKIPVGAGLGGGSSNGATVLLQLNHLWKLGLSLSELASLGAGIGSDVPFFVYGGTMLAHGRGEILNQCHLPLDYKCALIFPGFSVSTEWAYKNFKISLTNIQKNLKLADVFSASITLSDFKHYFNNELENVVFERYPELEKLKTALYKAGADYASMSGSGSSVFGLIRTANCDKFLKAFSLNPEYLFFFVDPIRQNHKFP